MFSLIDKRKPQPVERKYVPFTLGMWGSMTVYQDDVVDGTNTRYVFFAVSKSSGDLFIWDDEEFCPIHVASDEIKKEVDAFGYFSSLYYGRVMDFMFGYNSQDIALSFTISERAKVINLS